MLQYYRTERLQHYQTRCYNIIGLNRYSIIELKVTALVVFVLLDF